jgi:small-conductance mechanosensitive channel
MNWTEKIIGDLQRVADFHLKPTNLTIGSLVMLLILIGLVVVGEHLLRKHFIMQLLHRTHLQPSLQFAVGKIIGYCLLGLGVYIAFLAAGIDLSSLAIIAGAVGVGLGFGLQNIISNFVSGIIILAERPIAIGDRIVVGDVTGQVKAINLRSTTVVTNDNITVVVPNAEFIAKSVTNWSYGDPKVRFRIPVGVAYGTEVDKLKVLLLEVAHEHPKALRDPPPSVFFDGFGDSSLHFELAVWTAEMTSNPRRFRSDLNFAIEKKLRENSIEIPFPQRDLHLRSGTFVLKSAEPADQKNCK